ncbi:uncharacterized protein LOC110434073 isoform X2 [Sorghum bicolor]|nr:uncharacterized protein LOC110434073 isoform X2 [Sorghum bicolor]XP_021313421.1 uncharacterized protein LOC110434073 isoform X2 [Sorghum bicolor]|eukprot:XP_021313419.1 uncharacterized protein LOC110434073 isoform X2 [Sorghum bicolor]
MGQEKARTPTIACERGRTDGGRFEDEKEDDDDFEIVGFRRTWELCYASDYGSFEDITVPSMRYTFRPFPKNAIRQGGLQFFSAKVAELKEEEGLHWPLHVYGLIATRDSADPRRNLLFDRTRDSCQIITQEDPILQLTGPSRAVVLIDPVTIEVQLKAKCKTESEDKVLNFSVFEYSHQDSYEEPPFLTTIYTRCKRSKLEFAVAFLVQSVEATVRVRVVRGSWPDHFRGQIMSRTASISHGAIVLLDSRYGRMNFNKYGVIELSRCVVSVEPCGQLKVDVVASQVDDDRNVVAQGLVDFTPKMAGVSHGICDLGFCVLRFSVHWSLPCYAGEHVGLITK